MCVIKYSVYYYCYYGCIEVYILESVHMVKNFVIMQKQSSLWLDHCYILGCAHMAVI
jgi:hypothetical protein